MEVDLAVADLAEELVDRRAHDCLTTDRHFRRLDLVWDEALLAIIEGRHDQ